MIGYASNENENTEYIQPNLANVFFDGFIEVIQSAS
jgi:hypothetical protein